MARYFFLRADHAPVFLHQRDVGRGQSRGQINLSVGNAPIDLQFGQGRPLTKTKRELPRRSMLKVSSASFPWSSNCKSTPKAAVRAPGRGGRPPRRARKGSGFFDHDVLAGELRLHRGGKDVAVVRVRFRVDAQCAMSASSLSRSRKRTERKKRPQTPSSCAIDKGFDRICNVC